ncbi:hypothetical protein AB0C95_11560 [Streptomyces caniferus]|uniref:hypothetical protein n=1 Tax=Streptomyces caniferus TaxID=285557 RepID=UPI0033C646D0
MSRSELERLARIRMQVTGETLERAMAVLEGQTTYPSPPAASGAGPDPAEGGEVTQAGPVGEGEGQESSEDTRDSKPLAPPDGRRTPPKRNHLRGL